MVLDRSPFTRGDVNGKIPLSFGQNRLWFLHQLDPDCPAYNRPVMLRLQTDLRADLRTGALRLALNEIVRRHDVLRTSFPAEEGVPHQAVARELIIDLPLVDLTSPDRRSRLDRLAREEARRPFDLSAGPLIRAVLFRLAKREHVLLTTFHHTVFDGWSSRIFIRELGVLYDAFSAGEPSPLPLPPVQYADYARWQATPAHQQEIERQLPYWREKLASVTVFNPANRNGEGRVGGRRRFRIPAELTQQLRTLARKESATLYMVLLTAFKLLLQRYSGRHDIAVGTPVAGRRRTEVEGLIGCFVNTLVLRTDLSGDPSFVEMLGRVRATTLGALSNQDVPFEKLVEEIQPQRSLTHSPLFQVFFQLRNYPGTRRRFDSLAIEEEAFDLETTALDLTLELSEDQAGLSGLFIYNEGLFRAPDAMHMIEQYTSLLYQIVESPDRRAGTYTLVTRGAGSYLPNPHLPPAEPRYEPILSQFRVWAERSPDAVAIQSGKRSWTYGELETRGHLLARRLVASGVQPGDTVGIVGRRSAGTTTAMLAVLAAGGVMLPIPLDTPPERRRILLHEADAHTLLYVGGRGTIDASIARPAGTRVLLVDAESCLLSDSVSTDTAESLPDLPRVEPDDPAYIFFTSGTTGKPKGVLGLHKGISHLLSWQRETFDVGPGDRCSHLTTLSFDPVMREILLPLSSGATLCIPPEELEPQAVLPWLASEKVSILHVVPSTARAWLTETGPLPTSLRLAFFAGEQLTDALIRDWRSVVESSCEVVNLYGPTETTMVKCFYRVPSDPAPGHQPVGRALPFSQALVLTDANRLCGINEPGEVVLRTPFRTAGYINAPEENRLKFFPNPFRDDPGDLLYRTGDAGFYRPDGMLVITGRLDHQVKINGTRIEPDEIRAVLSRHPSVASAVVVAQKNQTGDTLAAYVVRRSLDVSAADLRVYLSRHLPPVMIPAAIVFLHALPLTPNGKVDRERLPVPQSDSPTSRWAAAETSIQEAIARIWAGALGRPRIGIDDDLFDIGGHSLLLLRIAARMREQLGVEVSIQQFFETPTVRELAAAVDVEQPALPDDDDIGDLVAALGGLSEQSIRMILKD